MPEGRVAETMPEVEEAFEEIEVDAPLVGIVIGSKNDKPKLQPAGEVLQEHGISYEVRVLSAHRTPDSTREYCENARMRGLKVIIAGAGGAAHLPGVTAAFTTLPVIGVPIESKSLKGLDSLLSIVQMPSGVPVATVAIGGARNAGLLATQIIATGDAGLQSKLMAFKERLCAESRAKNEAMQSGKVRDQKDRSV